MTESERIAAIVRGFAPVVEQYVTQQLQPLRRRLEQMAPAERQAARYEIAAELLRRAERS